MIRKFEKKDINRLGEIWLEASVIAHDFIPSEYWKSKVEDMKNTYIPMSRTFVYEDEGGVLGFVSLVDNYIAAIFVSPKHQGKGIGKQLMAHCKYIYNEIELAVYAKNTDSLAFYQKQGFVILNEGVDEDTGEKEIKMKYSK